MKTLTLDIGGTKFTLGLFDGDRLIRRETRRTNREGGRAWMLDQILSLALNWQKETPFQACGVGFGGPVDFERQTAALSVVAGGWEGFPLSRRLSERLGVPCRMDNDGNLGALAEGTFGAGAGYKNVFYMTISTGIGGGILSDGRILRGANSLAGEIGHLPIVPDGPECLCGGRGCLERFCCGYWLERDFGRPPAELFQDPNFVEGYTAKLALGLKACIRLLNPDCIVIGGGISKAGDRLFIPLQKEVERQTVTACLKPVVRICPSRLGDDVILFGALALMKGTAS